ncbi:MAG: ROK family transcriptional regulator, partial [Bifidobacteriaceae bacterium]|nr:ROK family transcriptional regulator [Bifidobacteriaceae bacterium]
MAARAPERTRRAPANGHPRRGSNVAQIGSLNDSVTLDAIRRSPDGTSRAELVLTTGLSVQAVSDICQRLLDQGLVEETGTTSVGIGRPRRTLNLVAASRFALGISLDPASVAYVLLDLRGAVVARTSQEIASLADPEAAVADMTRGLDELVAASGVDRSLVAGVGVSSPGPVDLAGGVLVS